MMPFLTETLSRVGGRTANQDACGFLLLDGAACWVVADGLGGHYGGEVASNLAVETILESFRKRPELSAEALESHFLAAHQAIFNRQHSEPRLNGMRTTAVALLSDGESFLFGHVGDSRLYYFHGGRICFQTKDHSVPQAMADAGEIPPSEIRHHEDRNRLLRSLGADVELRVAIASQAQRLYTDDAFLLCVDGFWEEVLETEMAVELAKASAPADWLKRMEARLARRAKPEQDNYTGIAIFYTDESATPQRFNGANEKL